MLELPHFEGSVNQISGSINNYTHTTVQETTLSSHLPNGVCNVSILYQNNSAVFIAFVDNNLSDITEHSPSVFGVKQSTSIRHIKHVSLSDNVPTRYSETYTDPLSYLTLVFSSKDDTHTLHQ